MSILSWLSKPYAKWVVGQQNKWSQHPVETQEQVFKYLIQQAAPTNFGRDHAFQNINSHQDYIQQVPIRTYEDFIPYIEKIKSGQPNVLWKGRPVYLAKTSGTTAGVKYIPITKESIPFHIKAAKDALLNYIFHTGKAGFLSGKLMFISGSPILEKLHGIFIGRLSGIVNHHVPAYLKMNQLPTASTNCIEDWELKMDTIVDETFGQNMSLISGIPPWIQMYFDRLEKKTQKKIKEIFPHFQLMVYGGVNFEPYKKKLFESIGSSIDTIETYPASEGFIAFQDQPNNEGLLLLLNSGIFYEFVPVNELNNAQPTRLTIGEVQLGVHYALLLTTNAGLWSYLIGDTVKFVSLQPARIEVTGRVKHFISAFGEHVIGEEVEKAMRRALELHPETVINEFTVAPVVAPVTGELPYHEWWIEFSSEPSSFQGFQTTLDQALVDLNVYYSDLIKGAVLQPLKIKKVPIGGFQQYMKSIGKLGGQNKLPRLSNDRKIAIALEQLFA
jgi:hypothetical protein